MISPIDAHILIENERARAISVHPKHNSRHESYAILLEEVDELWDEIKADASDERVLAEAIQVGAMALRFITEVCNQKEK
jgi:hypothetical protein